MKDFSCGRIARCAILLVTTIVVTSCSLFDWIESKPAPTAKVLWAVPDAGFITPAFDSVTGTVYFLANDHRVVALALDGKKRWEGRTFDGQGHSLGFGGC